MKTEYNAISKQYKYKMKYFWNYEINLLFNYLQSNFKSEEINHVYQPFEENLISDQEIVYNYNSPMLETSLWSNAKWDIHVFFIHYYFDHLLNFKREEKCNVVCKFIVHCHALRKKIGFLIRINGQIPYKIYFSI